MKELTLENGSRIFGTNPEEGLNSDNCFEFNDDGSFKFIKNTATFEQRAIQNISDAFFKFDERLTLMLLK